MIGRGIGAPAPDGSDTNTNNNNQNRNHGENQGGRTGGRGRGRGYPRRGRRGRGSYGNPVPYASPGPYWQGYPPSGFGPGTTNLSHYGPASSLPAEHGLPFQGNWQVPTQFPWMNTPPAGTHPDESGFSHPLPKHSFTPAPHSAPQARIPHTMGKFEALTPYIEELDNEETKGNEEETPEGTSQPPEESNNSLEAESKALKKQYEALKRKIKRERKKEERKALAAAKSQKSGPDDSPATGKSGVVASEAKDDMEQEEIEALGDSPVKKKRKRTRGRTPSEYQQIRPEPYQTRESNCCSKDNIL